MKAIVAASILLCASIAYVVSIEYRISQIERTLMEPGYLYHEHYSAGSPPVKRVVNTRRLVGESSDDWITRHNAAVAASLAEFPPV